MTIDKKAALNSTYPKLSVQWLNQAFPINRDKSCLYQSLCLVDSEVLRNPHESHAAQACADNFKTYI